MQNAKILGDYNIIKQIGQGPLGTVFLAEHRFMKKHFALKVLPEELATDRLFIQRFEEKIGILSKLEHPHIVKVHNISYANGIYFLVTDCVVDEMGETTNLAQYILSRRERLSEDELMGLLSQIADALDYAHSMKIGDRGVTHGGLKLNNILVSKKQSSVQLYISDFGLTSIVGAGAILNRTFKAVAEALEIGESITPMLGTHGQYPNPPISDHKMLPLQASFLQTFAFLAPEQKHVDDHACQDVKIDVYAFGVLTYYLITGKFPEGYFNLPSKEVPDYEWNWDTLVKNCLQFDAKTRAELLLPALNSVKDTKAPPEEPMPVEPQIRQEVSVSSQVRAPAQAETPNPVAEEIMTHSPQVVPNQQHELQPVIAGVREAPPAEPQTQSASQTKSLEKENLQPVIHDRKLERPVTDPDPGAIFSLESTVTHYVPEEKEVKETQPILTEMTVIKGGEFYRGNNGGNRDSMPYHKIFVDSFAIDVHPVTNEQFVRFLEALGGEKDSNHHDVIRLKESRIKRSAGKTSIESGYSKHPVVGVTWYGACAYAKWIGKRLPTEAEWEVASKGGSEKVTYPTGDDIEKSRANFFSSDTTAVMSYAPNGYGLYDMAGNVYEWCHDWYGYNYYEVSVQEPDNPKGPLQGVYRVLRGGCWKSLKDDLLCSRRHRNNPGTVNGTYGFRCAADVQ
ncbi:MAG: bifunctional serine/threonine-protein kinase/formylglycine-generating enzyme family protein [Chlamydiota bacterium]|nr:bifunctional serine/threonine-protein kinase/formylglycine-generating enzyme family protein [Chlamydiota bacterium]